MGALQLPLVDSTSDGECCSKPLHELEAKHVALLLFAFWLKILQCAKLGEPEYLV